jgi:hypothetical protein
MQCHGHCHWQWHCASHPWTGAAGTWALLGRLVPVGALGQWQWGHRRAWPSGASGGVVDYNQETKSNNNNKQLGGVQNGYLAPLSSPGCEKTRGEKTHVRLIKDLIASSRCEHTRAQPLRSALGALLLLQCAQQWDP